MRIVLSIVIIVIHTRVTSGPWKLLANTDDFYDAPPSQPMMADGSFPIDGVSYCDPEQYDMAIRAGNFTHEVEVEDVVQPAMDLLNSTSRAREMVEPEPRTKAKLKPEGPPPSPHDLEWLYNQIDGTFCHSCICFNNVIYLSTYCYMFVCCRKWLHSSSTQRGWNAWCCSSCTQCRWIHLNHQRLIHAIAFAFAFVLSRVNKLKIYSYMLKINSYKYI